MMRRVSSASKEATTSCAVEPAPASSPCALQILEAQQQRGQSGMPGPVIVLGEEDKEAMDELLNNELGDVLNRVGSAAWGGDILALLT